MRRILSDIANTFNKNSNRATRLVVINAVLFFVFAVIKFGFGLFEETALSGAAFSTNTLVSGSFQQVILHPWTLLFYPFSNEGLFSLIFDLILIYWFGNMLADFIGVRKMVLTYFCGAFFAFAMYFVVWGVFGILNSKLAYNGFLYGASPAAFALVFAFVALNPDGEIMFFTFRIKTRWLALIMLVLSVFRNPPLGVLDLGGATFGYLHMKLLRTGVNLTFGLEQLIIWIEGLNKQKKTIESFSQKQRSPQKVKVIKFTAQKFVDVNPSQEEIDFLLDKINKEGYENLSQEEKERLHKASQSAD